MIKYTFTRLVIPFHVCNILYRFYYCKNEFRTKFVFAKLEIVQRMPTDNDRKSVRLIMFRNILREYFLNEFVPGPVRR